MKTTVISGNKEFIYEVTYDKEEISNVLKEVIDNCSYKLEVTKNKRGLYKNVDEIKEEVMSEVNSIISGKKKYQNIKFSEPFQSSCCYESYFSINFTALYEDVCLLGYLIDDLLSKNDDESYQKLYDYCINISDNSLDEKIKFFEEHLSLIKRFVSSNKEYLTDINQENLLRDSEEILKYYQNLKKFNSDYQEKNKKEFEYCDRILGLFEYTLVEEREYNKEENSNIVKEDKCLKKKKTN